MKIYFLLLFSFVGVFGAAAQTYQNINLKGRVDNRFELELIPFSISLTLDIVRGNTGILVARTNEISNGAGGYDIYISSLNAGTLRHETVSWAKTNYSLRYSKGQYHKLTSTPKLVYSGLAPHGRFIQVQNINLNVEAYPNAVAGVYSDQVLISLQAH